VAVPVFPKPLFTHTHHMNEPSQNSRRDFLKKSALLGAAASVGGPLFGQNPRVAPAAAMASKADLKITDVKCYTPGGGGRGAAARGGAAGGAGGRGEGGGGGGGIFVEVMTDAGISGWGQCSGGDGVLMKQFIEGRFKRNLVGENPLAIRKLWDVMYYEHHDLGPSGTLSCALSGVDIALWDLAGRVFNVPVYKLMGGKFRDGTVKAYGSIGTGRWRMPIDECVKRSVEFIEAGFTALKLRWQIREHYLNPVPDRGFEYCAAVRKAVGDKVTLMVDGNNGYSAGRAVSTGRKLWEMYGVTHFEDPTSDQNLEALAQVVEALDHVEIVAGEMCYTKWQINDLLRIGKPDIINPDVCKCCGITELDRMATLAQLYQTPVQAHNTLPTIGTAASLHCLAAIPNGAEYLECSSVDTGANTQHRFFQNRVRLEKGIFYVPEGPGIGLEPNADLIRSSSA
jgi:L-alanine-DL-glutamate epimerase-like enolase superfamily enzyme